MKIPKGKRVQKHHISYEPEVIVKIYQGEHWILTNLLRRTKTVSLGFLIEVGKWVERMKELAIDLDKI
ncbi:MAG TPA: hypothetical protein ENI23_13770 [bacterium]|nr:hypothetical protein [bacterium]